MADKMFRTQFDDKPRYVADSGKAIKEEFVGRYDDKGRVVLVPNGTTNMYEYIQSYADSVDINVLLAKYKNGDIEALSRVQGMYADISDMPKTLADMLNKLKAGEEAFASLDVETRAKFNHNISEWFATAGSDEWFEKMGVSVEPPVIETPVIETPVVNKEVLEA